MSDKRTEYYQVDIILFKLIIILYQVDVILLLLISTGQTGIQGSSLIRTSKV